MNVTDLPTPLPPTQNSRAVVKLQQSGLKWNLGTLTTNKRREKKVSLKTLNKLRWLAKTNSGKSIISTDNKAKQPCRDYFLSQTKTLPSFLMASQSFIADPRIFFYKVHTKLTKAQKDQVGQHGLNQSRGEGELCCPTKSQYFLPPILLPSEIGKAD